MFIPRFAPAALVAAGLFAAAPAHAVVIGFETVEGYVPGSVAGQPTTGTQWTVTGGGIGNVGAAGGNPTQYLAITHDGSTGDNFQSVRFSPTSADLGGAPFPANVDFSFDLRLDSYDAANSTVYGTISLLRDATGANQGRALRLGFSYNGTIQIVSDSFSGGNLTLSGSNRPFNNATDFVTFSGTANFADNTTTLFINGSAVNSGSAFSFANKAGTGSDSFGYFEAALSNVAGTYSLDNLVLAVPEPSSLALLSLGGVLLMGARRKA